MIKLPESNEDYLKAKFTISKKKKGGWVSNKEISEFLNVKPASVSGMLFKLEKKRLINWQPRTSVRLTKKGKEVASSIIEKNRELYLFFKDVLKIKDIAVMQDLCCKIEHYITPEVSNALKILNIEFHH